MRDKVPSRTEYELLVLTIKERTGREIADAYRKSVGRRISYGTLYTTLRRMKEAGWIAVRDDEDQDGRLKWFRILGAGARALQRARAPFIPDPLAVPKGATG